MTTDGHPPPIPPDYLRPLVSDRGFAHLPPIPATHAGQPAGHARVYQSSAATEPCLWLQVVQPADRNHPGDGNTIEATIHVRAEDMWHLAQQIEALIRHQNGGALPSWATGI